MVRIVGVKARVFTYESNTGLDSEGHKHPAKLHQAKHALLTITDEDGVEGHCLIEPDCVRSNILDGMIKPILLEYDAYARERIWQEMFDTQRMSQGRMSDRTIGAVDMALWDLAGRKLGLPVYKLIGSYRDKVPAYGSTMCGDQLEGGLSTPEDYARFAEWLVKRGYKAIKLHTWNRPVPWAPDVKMDARACAAVREAVGPDIDLMLDPHHSYSRADALWLGRQIEALDYYWYEEPMNEASMSSYKWLSDSLTIPVLGPETVHGKYYSRAEWAKADASDITRAGVNDVGGISPSLKIIHLAEAFGMNCEIHASHAGNITLTAVQRNGRWYERGLLHPFVDYDKPPAYLNSIWDPMDNEGYVHLSDKPGLGFDLNLDYIDDNLVKA